MLLWGLKSGGREGQREKFAPPLSFNLVCMRISAKLQICILLWEGTEDSELFKCAHLKTMCITFCGEHKSGFDKIRLKSMKRKMYKRIFYIHHNVQYLWRENTSGSSCACVWMRPTLLWRVTCLPGHVWHQGHVLLADMEPGDGEEHQGGQHRHHGHHSLSDTELLLLSIVTKCYYS